MVILLQRGRCQQEAREWLFRLPVTIQEVLDTRVFPIYALPCQWLYEKVVSSYDSLSFQSKAGMHLQGPSLVYNDKGLIPIIRHAREEDFEVVEERFGDDFDGRR